MPAMGGMGGPYMGGAYGAPMGMGMPGMPGMPAGGLPPTSMMPPQLAMAFANHQMGAMGMGMPPPNAWHPQHPQVQPGQQPPPRGPPPHGPPQGYPPPRMPPPR